MQKNDSNLNPSGIVGEVSVQEFDSPPFAYTLIIYMYIYQAFVCLVEPEPTLVTLVICEDSENAVQWQRTSLQITFSGSEVG